MNAYMLKCRDIVMLFVHSRYQSIFIMANNGVPKRDRPAFVSIDEPGTEVRSLDRPIY